MDFNWASYGLGVVTGVVGVAAALAGLGFWAWATNKRGLDTQDIDNQFEEAKYEAPYTNQVSSVHNRIPTPPLTAVRAGMTDAQGHPTPQLGIVDHHRTRPRRTG